MELQVPSTFNEVSEIELLYRSKVKPALRPSVSKSQDAYSVLLHHWDLDKIELQEQFKVLLLNTANKVIGLYETSSGSGSGCLVDARLVFACALKANAHQLIICHNHPSGSLKASDADLNLTRRLVQAGKLLDIPVIDLLIITGDGSLCFADEGLL